MFYLLLRANGDNESGDAVGSESLVLAVLEFEAAECYVPVQPGLGHREHHVDGFGEVLSLPLRNVPYWVRTVAGIPAGDGLNPRNILAKIKKSI